MLLDTHVWVAVAEGDARLVGPRGRRRLAREAATGNLRLSTVSVFELTALHTAGRVLLSLPVETWMRASIDQIGLRLSDVSRAIAIDAGLIPTSALTDPFDRLLVATARSLGVPLMTRDQRIIDYARATGQVPIVNAAA